MGCEGCEGAVDVWDMEVCGGEGGVEVSGVWRIVVCGCMVVVSVGGGVWTGTEVCEGVCASM